MSILKEADFYYGAVLSTLINRGICPALVESGKDRQIYDFVTNKKEFRLFVKYRSRPINTKTPEYSSWQFHFSDDDKRELTLFMSDEKHLSVGLVCSEDQLNKSQYAVSSTFSCYIELSLVRRFTKFKTNNKSSSVNSFSPSSVF